MNPPYKRDLLGHQSQGSDKGIEPIWDLLGYRISRGSDKGIEPYIEPHSPDL
jgi:hypothetical protein